MLVLNAEERERLEVVLVRPRNPLNIGAAARAMANFGLTHLTVVEPWEPSWRSARSAVGAPELLTEGREAKSVAEAVGGATYVVGTGSLTYRKPDQEADLVERMADPVRARLAAGEWVAILFGPEKHGLTREDLSYCHALAVIPTDDGQPSMNLGQAVAVCLYELAGRGNAETQTLAAGAPMPATAETLERLEKLVLEVMAWTEPQLIGEGSARELRELFRRLSVGEKDGKRVLGTFRRILWRFRKLS